MSGFRAACFSFSFFFFLFSLWHRVKNVWHFIHSFWLELASYQLSVSVARDKKVKFGQRLFVGPRARLCFNSPFEHLLGNAPSS